jgi:hypothetical protein
VVNAQCHRRLTCVALLGSLPLFTAASCRATPTDCTHDSNQRCLWEQGVVTPVGDDGELDGGELGDPDGTDPTERAEFEHTLARIIEIMQVGLEWPLVDQRARTLCSERDADGEIIEAAVMSADAAGTTDEAGATDEGESDKAAPVGESASAWSCPVANLELDGQSLALEASQGVISLSASELDGPRSKQLFERARTRFAQKCLGDFEEIEGARLEVFYRCALPEGPFLVIARFPRDLEADLWQVSIAVVDAG